MKPLRTVAFFGTATPTPFDLLQARGQVWLHLLHGNWNILIGESDGLRPVVEYLCAGRLYTVASHRTLVRADRIITINRPDVARLSVVRGRETWFFDDARRIIPRPLGLTWEAA